MEFDDKVKVARKRWKMLIDVISKKKSHIDSSSSLSVRRFGSFGLVETKALPRETAEVGHVWFEYSCPTFPEFKADLRHLDGEIQLEDLLGFNNTGNVCVWPSEEVLMYYCLQRKDKFRDKAVCELGGGMTSLAGIAVAACTAAKEVCLTDGNNKSVQNVSVIIDRNKEIFGTSNVSSRVLLWDEYDTLNDLEGAFDLVICGDCFFFDDYRAGLLKTLYRLLKPQGEVISFAPTRGDTFQQFEDMAQEYFTVKKCKQYDNTVWELHQQNVAKGLEVYDENIHYPLLLQLVKDKDTATPYKEKCTQPSVVEGSISQEDRGDK